MTCLNCGAEVFEAGVNTVGIEDGCRHRYLIHAHPTDPVFGFQCEGLIVPRMQGLPYVELNTTKHDVTFQGLGSLAEPQ